MNKLNRFMAVRLSASLFVALSACFMCLCGCSESEKLTGTAVEPNEMAQRDSSSSEVEEKGLSSSSEKDEVPQSSSSDGKGNTLAPEPHSVSSSSIVPIDYSSSSSTRTPGDQSGTKPGADLADYGAYYGVPDEAFANVVVASVVVYGNGVVAADPIQDPNDSTDTHPGSSTVVTELNNPGLHKMGDRLDALHAVFRESADTLIALGKQAAAEDPSCETYLYNVRGQAGSIGHMLVGVASDTLTVLDIRDEKCRSTEDLVVGFVFIYCGEMDSKPYEKRVYVDRDPSAGKCPAVDLSYEWTN